MNKPPNPLDLAYWTVEYQPKFDEEYFIEDMKRYITQMDIKTAAKKIIDLSKMVTVGELMDALKIVLEDEYDDLYLKEAVLELLKEGEIRSHMVIMNCTSFKPHLRFERMVLVPSDVNILGVE